MVSFVDQQAESKLKEGLSAIFPEAKFIAEESDSNYDEVGNGYYWVIDPLDGTTNFLHGLPVYAVSVGLIYNKQPILGMIYEPNQDEMFYASKGNGAFLNDKSIQVSPAETLATSLLATGFPYYDFLSVSLPRFIKGINAKIAWSSKDGSSFDRFSLYGLRSI